MDKLNKVQKKLRWTDDERRTVLQNHKALSVQELATLLGKTDRAIINQCARMGCSYFNEKPTHSRTDLIGLNGNDSL